MRYTRPYIKASVTLHAVLAIVALVIILSMSLDYKISPTFLGYTIFGLLLAKIIVETGYAYYKKVDISPSVSHHSLLKEHEKTKKSKNL